MDSNDFSNATEAWKDWAEAFQEMAKNGDDELVIPDIFEDEDLNDWTWKHFANTSFTTAKSQNI